MNPGKDYIGVGVGAMIFNDKGELLLLQRGPKAKNERGCWQIPGGGIDFGETMAQAIVREVKEEIGADIELLHQLVTIDHLIPAENQHWITTTFVARLKDGQAPRIVEPHKHSALGWFSLNRLPQPLAITFEPGLQAYGQYQKDSHRDIYKAAAVIVKDGQTLLERSFGKPVFVSPGGKIEPGETAGQALVRELKEELNIKVGLKDLEPFGIFTAEAANHPGQRVQIQVFMVKKWQGDIKPGKEVEEILWLTSKLPKNVELGSIFVQDILPRLKREGLVD